MTSSQAWLSEFHVEDKSSQQSNVVSMSQLGSIAGALLAFFAVDKLGRLQTARLCCVVWIIGVVIWITSAGSVGQTYAGRFIAGIAFGAIPVTCPSFLVELAPPTIRGLTVTVFSASVYVGIVLSYFANYGSQQGFPPTSSKTWQVPVGMHLVYAGILLLSTIYVRESPRYLVKQGKHTAALDNLSWYRNLPKDDARIRAEMHSISFEYEKEKAAIGGKSFLHRLKSLFSTSANLYRLFVVGFGIQILSQWSGGGSLTIYAEKILQLVGVKSNASLYTTGIFGIVKLFSSLLCAFFLVDFLGRKRSVFLGIGLQTLAALYLTIYLSKVNPSNEQESPSQHRASIAAIVMVFISGVGWALGFNSIQYLIGAEIWQMELRGLATSLIMALHFANQYGSSRAIQPMLDAFDRWGLFAFWTVIGIIALLYILFFIPETAGRSLESMNALFDKSWFQIGLMSTMHQTFPTDQEKMLSEQTQIDGESIASEHKGQKDYAEIRIETRDV
ncbi:hypothetical protein MVES_002295 [Malassezia vespertilionis]|uniref:Major facilitator superfamily (MFS) profile domain-containing protein n=2 Tax=Malassezia vespertilionis TaxID=2020962 RepID=A0A2N1JBS7_9BASI|nr:hypothetical protein MVES_002295 [Malassezia vespertilionis]